ncbi:MAG: hypothetical protein WB608_21905, partial [Terracidiphilus sp.]
VSVGFAPPVLPVYVQPPCPQPGWMWTPGYWAYGDDGYYWVPGTWVPAPYEGALWTPPYWGWSGGLYVFHTGYWGPHVGYYGGVNYGFGYMGIGFVGGMWRGHDFVYNTAVVHVDNRYIHNTYVDRAVVDRYTVARDSRVAYSGGPGGIRHDPSPEERTAMHEQHVGRTSFQTQHVNAAMSDRNSYFNSNHGRPTNVAVARPMAPQSGSSFNSRGGSNPSYNAQSRSNPQPSQSYQNRNMHQPSPSPQPQYQRSTPREESRPSPQQSAPREQHQSKPEKDHR